MKSEKAKVLSREEILLFLRKKKPYLKRKFGVTKIALFGSYARSEQKIKSDIDLLIETSICDFRNRLRLQEYLEKHFNKKVDLIYFSAVRKFIMRNIQEDIIYA